MSDPVLITLIMAVAVVVIVIVMACRLFPIWLAWRRSIAASELATVAGYEETIAQVQRDEAELTPLVEKPAAEYPDAISALEKADAKLAECSDGADAITRQHLEGNVLLAEQQITGLREALLPYQERVQQCRTAIGRVQRACSLACRTFRTRAGKRAAADAESRSYKLYVARRPPMSTLDREEHAVPSLAAVADRCAERQKVRERNRSSCSTSCYSSS